MIEALRVIRLLSPLAIEPLAHLIALLMFDYRYRLDSGRRLLAVEALGRVNPDCREQYAEMLARIIQPSDESTDVMLGALRTMSDLRPATIARHESIVRKMRSANEWPAVAEMIARQWDPAIEFASDARELAVEMLRRAGLEP